MSLKILAALVVLVVLGVLTSVHGYVSAQQRMHPSVTCPLQEAQDAQGPVDGSMEACSTATGVFEIETPREMPRVQKRTALHGRRRIASTWDCEAQVPSAVSGS